MNRTPYSTLADRYCARVQRGSALLDVALALAITGAMLAGGMQYWSQQLRSDTARALAGQYKLINAAVASYMIVNWALLTDKLPAICDEGSVFTNSGGAAEASNNCSVKVTGNDGNSLQIRHALQPTVQELQQLNFLTGTVNGQPVLPEDPNVITWSRHSGAWKQTTHTLAIHIQRVCTNQQDPNPATCVQANRDLRSVVFNQWPYRTGINGDWTMLNEAMLAMENDGLVSMPNVGGVARKIVGLRGDTELPNPILGVGTNLPPLGVLAIRNGYGSSGWGEFTRRDGTAPPTADWNFDRKSLTNVNRFQGDAVVAENALRIPQKDPGTTCDAAVESMSLSTTDQAVQVCKGGIWRRNQGRGADPTDFQDFQVIGGKAVVSLDPSQWGMPQIISMTNGSMTIPDRSCKFNVDNDAWSSYWVFGCINTHWNNSGARAYWMVYPGPSNNWIIEAVNLDPGYYLATQAEAVFRFYRIYQ